MTIKPYLISVSLLAPLMAHAGTSIVTTAGLTVSGQVTSTNVGPVAVATANSQQTKRTDVGTSSRTSPPTLEITKPKAGVVGRADLVTYTQQVEYTSVQQQDSFSVNLAPATSSLAGSEYIIYTGNVSDDGTSPWAGGFGVSFSVYGNYRAESFVIPGLPAGSTVNQASVLLSVGGASFTTPTGLSSSYDTGSNSYSVHGNFWSASPVSFSLAFYAGDDASISSANIGFSDYNGSYSERNVGESSRTVLDTYEIPALAVPEPDGTALALAGLAATGMLLRRRSVRR